ncbi:MAG: enoyl-CoA hydratase/isomerase family protein [Alphaproteobacteria bacterium]|nr:enoyl-CoA hydratase/isomerase family protein [Alphaproteobacteria bacterium]
MTDSSTEEVLFEIVGKSGIITLNRPAGLNALTLNMVRLMKPVLADWAVNDAVENIIIEGAGEKGFCAGGDIRALHDWGKAGAPEATDFYREEYQLNRSIKTYPKPYIALIDGITMGGGVGVSVHGSHRVATERTMFAMPETGIGLLPDVGGTYFLPRLPGETGAWLVLTGARLRGADSFAVGVATHYTASHNINALKADLAAGGDVDAILATHHQQPEGATLPEQQGDIDRLFKADSVAEIIAALKADGSDWAHRQAAAIATKSPTSVAVALRQMREGIKADFDECMRIEMRAVTRIMAQPDFYEGVRATILEKATSSEQVNAPNWTPQQDIDAIFAPLGKVGGDAELRFDDEGMNQ